MPPSSSAVTAAFFLFYTEGSKMLMVNILDPSVFRFKNSFKNKISRSFFYLTFEFYKNNKV